MFVCADWESNPGHNVGNVVLYHSTTGAIERSKQAGVYKIFVFL